MYAVNFTQMLAQGITKANKSWPTVQCQNGWEFDKEELPYTTISTEVSLFFFSYTGFSFQLFVENVRNMRNACITSNLEMRY